VPQASKASCLRSRASSSPRRGFLAARRWMA
jgi:hypothetical protein